MFEKVGIWAIITNHLKTLKNHNTKKAGWDDYFTFLVLPVLVAALLTWLNITLTDAANNIIIATLAILVGLLFNVIVIIFDIIKRDASQELKNELLKELLTNISYSILLSIFIIGLTLLTYIDNEIFKKIATAVVYFFIGHYFLTVLMILKRMYVLFNNELDEIEENEKPT